MRVNLKCDDGQTYTNMANGHVVTFEKCRCGAHEGKYFMVDRKGGWICYELIKEIKYVDRKNVYGKHARILQQIEVGEGITHEEAFFRGAKKKTFCINDGKGYEGYTFCDLWNGWEMPYFTKEVAEQICKDFSDEEYHYQYNARENCFDCIDTDDCIAIHTNIHTEDDVFISVYDFTSTGWCWEIKIVEEELPAIINKTLNKEVELEDVELFYEWLQGKSMHGFEFREQPQLTPNAAFAVIYMLQEGFGFIPDTYEQCPYCNSLYDSNDGCNCEAFIEEKEEEL